MMCRICSGFINFKQSNKGVTYKGTPICAECVLAITVICIDQNMGWIKRHIKEEIKLDNYSE